MKKILIVVPSFNSGGTISSLLNVASSLDRREIEVFVYAITNYGPNKDSVSKVCKIIGESQEAGKGVSENSLKLFIKRAMKRLFFLLQSVGIDLSRTYFRRAIKRLETYQFDFIIAFQEGTATRFVSMIPFSRRIAWVRSEYSRYLKLCGYPDETPIYDRFEKIVSVSRSATNNFLERMPQYKDKTLHVYNIINEERVLKLSKEVVNYNRINEAFNIISIGRIDPVKRFEFIPGITEGLIKKGFKINWIVIGGYSEKNEYVFKELKGMISDKGLQDKIHLLGQKNNPYPYLKESDLLVSLSSSETFNNTLTEAKILGVPVVTTDYGCALESIKDKEEGLIVPIGKIEDAIGKMISDKGFYCSVKDHLSHFKYNGNSILDDWYTKILN